jgi:hypothetical protein
VSIIGDDSDSNVSSGSEVRNEMQSCSMVDKSGPTSSKCKYLSTNLIFILKYEGIYCNLLLIFENLVSKFTPTQQLQFKQQNSMEKAINNIDQFIIGQTTNTVPKQVEPKPTEVKPKPTEGSKPCILF